MECGALPAEETPCPATSVPPKVRAVGSQAFQLDLAQTYSMKAAYDRVFYDQTVGGGGDEHGAHATACWEGQRGQQCAMRLCNAISAPHVHSAWGCARA